MPSRTNIEHLYDPKREGQCITKQMLITSINTYDFDLIFFNAATNEKEFSTADYILQLSLR